MPWVSMRWPYRKPKLVTAFHKSHTSIVFVGILQSYPYADAGILMLINKRGVLMKRRGGFDASLFDEKVTKKDFIVMENSYPFLGLKISAINPSAFRISS
jgi:hypothetical protein